VTDLHVRWLSLVDSARPLPVQAITAQDNDVTPLTGSTATATLAGPFTPAGSRPIMLTLGGSWQGSVRVLRSIDGGTTKTALTLAGDDWGLFTANACEPVWSEEEPGAAFYLDLAPASGTVTYRLAQ